MEESEDYIESRDRYNRIERKIENKDNTKVKNTYLIVKRLLDIVLSFIGMILLLPIIIIISIIVKCDSKGPIFFRHKRIGQNGKIIYIYKFRTMCQNAEEMIKKFTPEQMKEFKTYYKLEKDPRITKVGDFLRKSSLDELPQMLNIFRGDLSIVGPRPIVPKELEKYGEDKEKFLSTKPGLTGYWQANGRSNTTYEERIKMELYYIDNQSLWLDIKIFFKTFGSVIKKEGAK
jgi:lipopolysaccharide/colanic/teichoic acid biosynthesis glycosyltransferase